MDGLTLERVLGDAFARVDPAIQVRIDRGGSLPGRYLATVQSVQTEVAWLSPGWPCQVRDLLGRSPRPGLVVADELSTGARELLTEQGLSWVDGTGAARVALPGVYIRVDGARARRTPPVGPGWTPATLAVCEALITGTSGTVAALTSVTGLAPSTVAASLRFVQGLALLESGAARGRNARRTVADPDRLLEAYAQAAAALRSPEHVRVGVLWRDVARGVSDLGRRLTARGVAWSLTGALAADVLAPYLTEVDPWEVYVDGGSLAAVRQIGRDVGLEEADGGRLLLRPFPTPAKDALSARVDGRRLSPWPRVFADLRLVGVRGEDAADHLRERMGAGA